LQTIYNRIEIAQQPQNFFPAIYEFFKEIFTNPLFKDLRQTIKEITKPDVTINRELNIRLINRPYA
jgi:hypothetical protein